MPFDLNNEEDKKTIISTILGLLYSFITFFAIFLSYKCNGGKFTFGGFIGALCCSPFYIAYKLGTSWDKCM